MLDDSGHIPVMVDEILRLLAPRVGETYLDLTLGRGGHASAVAERLGAGGTVVGLDLDEANIEYSSRRLAAAGPSIHLEARNFLAAPDAMRKAGLAADLILADLGFSSTQMDDPSRGFSFTLEGPLDMRLDRESPVTAATIVNESSERELAEIIRRYGDEPLARKIAATIVAERKNRPILTTARLARLVRSAYGPRADRSRIHPATRAFMALRIAVNDELGALESLWARILRAAEGLNRTDRPEGEWTAHGWINPGARIAVIAFHSLEDRIVKRAMADLVERGLAVSLTRKPLSPSEAEVEANPRSRSAKLRAIRVTAGLAEEKRG